MARFLIIKPVCILSTSFLSCRAIWSKKSESINRGNSLLYCRHKKTSPKAGFYLSDVCRSSRQIMRQWYDAEHGLVDDDRQPELHHGHQKDDHGRLRDAHR